MIFPVVTYGCESWTVKKAERWIIDAFELWCWRRLLRVPWTVRRSNQSILKEISLECSLEGLMLKLTPILWLPHAKNWFIWKDPDVRKDWRWEEKGMTDDEAVGWHHWFNGYELQYTLEVGDGQGSLMCYSPWGHKELDMPEQLTLHFNPEYSLEDWCWRWSSNTLATWCEELALERTLMLGKTEGRRRRGRQKKNGWMASLIQWIWVWANSRKQGSTGKPGLLQSMGLQSLTWLSNWVTIMNGLMAGALCVLSFVHHCLWNLSMLSIAGILSLSWFNIMDILKEFIHSYIDEHLAFYT